MNLRHFILLRFLFFLVIITTFFSCNKTNKYDLGEGLNQNNAGVRLLTNIPVNAVTIKSNPEATDEALYQLGGDYYDPYFGRHKAILMQEFFREKVAAFDGTVVLDSIVWSLAYVAHYGDLNAAGRTQVFNVYEITGDFTSANTFISNEDPYKYTNASKLIGTYSAYINDTVVRLKLSNVFGERVLNVLKQSGSISNELKGLMLYPYNPGQTLGQGVIFSFDLLDAASKLLIYYHDDSGGIEVFDGLISTPATATYSTQHASLFSHDYSSSVFADQLTGTVNNPDHIYIQSMNGTDAKIDIPIIETFKDSGIIIINKAEIIFKIDASITDLTKYKTIDKMYLLPVDSSGITLSIKDLSEIIVVYGGNYDPVNMQYKFNIGRYVQDVLNGKIKNYGMRLFAAESKIKSDRTILKTKENIIFNLTYTKF